MKWREYITSYPAVKVSKPVFRCTRITVEFILESLGEGASEAEIVANYIGLNPCTCVRNLHTALLRPTGCLELNRVPGGLAECRLNYCTMPLVSRMKAVSRFTSSSRSRVSL